jgi:glucosylglycerate synthase
VQQVVVALFGSLRAHEQYWLKDAVSARPIQTMGAEHGVAPAAPEWDFRALGESARKDLAEIRPLLVEALGDETRGRLLATWSSPDVRLDDGLWVRIVYDFVAASRRGQTGPNDLASIFVPLYLWRAACFMGDTATEAESAMQRRLDSLCDTFEHMRPILVQQWMAGEVRSS